MTATVNASQAACSPWWKFGYVWLVIAGPAAVLVAGTATVWLALAFPETLVAQDYYRQGIKINKTLAAQRAAAMVPAMQARNHAAAPAPAPTQMPAPAR